jgi:NAD(P)H-nitrite reductase large subunit
MDTSYLVVGDGIAGSSAAETLREEDPEADITVVTDEGEALYNRILIKEFAKGKLPEAPISIHEPEWYAERDIDLRLNTHVTRVEAVHGDVPTEESETLVRAARELVTYLTEDDETALSQARDRLSRLG